jgi:SAM-dependent methyltransferase
VLALPVGARILDCPCGQGRHAHLLAESGYDVDGVDYSAALLKRARERGTGRQLRYTRADMRKLPARWNGRFDAVVNLFTSFGFFAEPADDARVIREFARVLKPGGVLVWHGASRDGVAARFLARDWWRTSDGTLVVQSRDGVAARFLARDWWRTSDGTLVVQQRHFDPLSGILTVDTEWRGPRAHGERSHRIRLYTATRLAELCAAAGLIVEEAYDNWRARPLRRASGEMLLVARRDG